MKVAITGGTGFVGRNLAAALAHAGHDVVLVARGVDDRALSARSLPRAQFVAASIVDARQLAGAFAGCDAVAHCAGINREIGNQTYEAVHVQGTENVIAAARAAGVKKLVLLSFLRARPDCGSPYHESKWKAEESVRASGLDYTILKPGVIYGKGDHMLDHLSHAFHTFPLFGLVGFRDTEVKPVAVADVVKILVSSIVDGRLSRETVSVLGPETMGLSTAVKRVAATVGKRPLFFRLPVVFHYGLARICEAIMKVPLVSWAQVRILSEGVTEPLPSASRLPADLLPAIPFSEQQIRLGLPEGGPFGAKDLRCCG
jgi:nucleoside-diphosphate-sugar epimerase